MTPNVLIGIVEILKTYEVKIDSDILSEIVELFVNEGMTKEDLEECYGVDNELDFILDEYESIIDENDQE
jgi:hypothetical protein